jgi:hypothetical protein
MNTRTYDNGVVEVYPGSAMESEYTMVTFGSNILF